MNIREMKVGECGRVSGYSGNDREYRHKLLRMGLVKRAEFKVVRRAPMGDPIEIELRGFNLTLRRAEADALEVEVIR